jgi:predicted GH43/DUF377 family glycosyl hydrolase
VLQRDPLLRFHCPVSGADVAWAAKDVFNPGAVVREGRIHLLVRAEDAVGPFSGTSRIGLATSDDGVRFALEPACVLFPADDEWQSEEWPGGCEDPRVVESPDGGYVCLYTAFDGRVGRLFAASSPDLRRWTKHGPASAGTPYAKRWSKSGAFVTELRDDRLVAARRRPLLDVLGRGICFAATSPDLVRWEPVEFDASEDRHLSHDRTRRARAGRSAACRASALRPLAFRAPAASTHSWSSRARPPCAPRTGSC